RRPRLRDPRARGRVPSHGDPRQDRGGRFQPRAGQAPARLGPHHPPQGQGPDRPGGRGGPRGGAAGGGGRGPGGRGGGGGGGGGGARGHQEGQDRRGRGGRGEGREGREARATRAAREERAGQEIAGPDASPLPRQAASEAGFIPA